MRWKSTIEHLKTKLKNSRQLDALVRRSQSILKLDTMRENPYRKKVFLSSVLNKPDYKTKRVWTEHQEMQVEFLRAKGFCPSSNILDVGCGPLRLGVKLIPELETGWYFGQDINRKALELGRKVLSDAEVNSYRYTLLCSNDFDMNSVDRKIDIAFSNSLFSHLRLNSILICLIKVRKTLKPSGVYYSTFFNVAYQKWSIPCPQRKWEREFYTFPDKDPYHYNDEILRLLAKTAGFELALEKDFGHPTQTMACFTPVDY